MQPGHLIACRIHGIHHRFMEQFAFGLLFVPLAKHNCCLKPCLCIRVNCGLTSLSRFTNTSSQKVGDAYLHRTVSTLDRRHPTTLNIGIGKWKQCCLLERRLKVCRRLVFLSPRHRLRFIFFIFLIITNILTLRWHSPRMMMFPPFRA